MSKSGAQILMTDRFFADELPTNRGAVQQRSPWPIDLARITHFFEHYKDLEPNKWVKVLGWEDADVAQRLILEGIARVSAPSA